MLTIDDVKFILPQRWSDISQEQYLQVAKLSTRELSLAEFRVLMLMAVTGMRVARKHHVLIDGKEYFYLQHGLTHEFLVSAGQLLAICQSFDFMFRKEGMPDEEPVYTLQFSGVKQLIPEIQSPYGLLYGPADGLSNLTMAEYIKTETAYSEWIRSHKLHHALQIMAVLWRPGKKGYNPDTDTTGDRREAYNPFTVDANAGRLAAMPREYANGVLMWYESCQRFIRDKWPEIYEGEQSKEKVDAFTGFMRLVTSLADNDVTKAEAVRAAYLYDTLFSLQSMAKQYKKMKEQTKTAKS
jgi:hypothetical protein